MVPENTRKYAKNLQHEASLRQNRLGYPNREVPVDVHINHAAQNGRTVSSSNYHNPYATHQQNHHHHQTHNHTSHIRVPSSGLPYLDQPQYWMHPDGSASVQPDRCWRCGLLGPCACVRADNMGVQSSVYVGHPNQDSLVVKNAVRLARNRKVNASFRAAVDRSYG